MRGPAQRRAGCGRSPRTAGVARARELFAAHAESERTGVPADELLQARAAARPDAAREGLHTRRELLAAGACAAAGAALAGRPAQALARALGRRSQPRIAIVGGGLAGLSCAHMLWTRHPHRPIAATVYEANPERAGGRCWTLRDHFSNGLISEHGGSFLNRDQHAVRGLVRRLGLQEEVVGGGDLPTGEEAYWIDGALYTYREANADWGSFGYRAFKAAARELLTPAGEQRLDALSVPEWLASTDIGASSRFGRLMLANAVTENGGDPADMSALDLIELTAGNPRSSLSPIPGDDETFHVIGGNDQIVERVISQLAPGAMQHGFELQALRANADGTATLSFQAAGAAKEVTADIVVLALPFSTLRDVDLSRSGLSAAKQRVVRTLGMGSNAKIHVELARKTWPGLGYSGAAYGDWDGFCCAWDDSVPLGPDASPALFLGFPGGHRGASGLTGAAHGTAPAADVDWFLGVIEPLYPGTTAAYTGRAYEDHWALDPWVKGAYSYYRVGQASTYNRIAAAGEGPYLFAGEHTSLANQGFLDGAVETGERAALRLLARAGAGAAAGLKLARKRTRRCQCAR
jgi:monoamine oxidase